MFVKFRYSVPALLQVATVMLAASPSLAGWKSENYGAGNVDVFTPSKPAPKAGIVLSLHYCTGTAQNAQGWFQSLAEQHGFYVIAPKSKGSCWDAGSSANQEKASLVQMVQYVIQQHNADASRVFAAGASSGACMTQAMLASYPDVFAGGSVLAGVPVGGWPDGDTTCTKCNQDALSKTAQQWGDIVRNAKAGFSGTRPRLQLWHGDADATLKYPSQLNAEVAQWTNVFGVSDADATKESNKPKSGWTRTSYKKDGTVVLEVNIGAGQGHDLTGQNLWSYVVQFFGLDKATEPGDGGAGGAGGSVGPTEDGGHSGTGGAGGKGNKADAGLEGSGGSTHEGVGGTANTAGTKSGGTGGSRAGKGGSQSSGGSTQTAGDSTGAGGKGGSTVDGKGGSSTVGKGGSPAVGTGGTTKGETAGGGDDDEGNGNEPTSGGCSFTGNGSVAPAGAAIGLLIALGGNVLRRRRRRDR